MTPYTTIEDIVEFLDTAEPGTTLTYHVGFLAADRLKYQTQPNGGVKEVAIEPYDTIASVLWKAYEFGYVHLYQMRVAPYTFAYLAEKR